MIEKQKKLLIVTVIIFLILITAIIVSKNSLSEEKNSQIYEQALSTYQANDLQEAYYQFGKISSRSELKPAAIYRQALSARKLGDEKSTIKKFNEVIRKYSHTPLEVRARYLKAQYLYELNNHKKAKKEFAALIKKYPQNDYSYAAGYYLGVIEVDNLKKIKKEKKKQKVIKKASHYFREYLKEAPTGRFALDAAKIWTSISPKMTNEDNLIIAKAYIENSENKKAQQYLQYTNIEFAWPYFVKNAYNQKNYSKVKYYTELGLKSGKTQTIAINEVRDENQEQKSIYDAIDMYLKASNSQKTALSYLLSIADKSKGYDYLLYKSCNNLPQGAQGACFNTLYAKYPKGQFAAESLANIFYLKIRARQYHSAEKLGKIHLINYPQSNSAPRVMFWLAKLNERSKNYEAARGYYKSLLKKYPDDYYAYRAFLNLNRYTDTVMDTNDMEGKVVSFPYKSNAQNNMIIKLAEVRDYALVNELCKEDKFIQSWLAFEQGNYSLSSTLAQDAMDKLEKKPSRVDLRWRLVYPIHYFKEIRENAVSQQNSPILMLSIIREESHFNPRIKSSVGAMGLMQLMPSTAAEVAKGPVSADYLYNPANNIKLGNIYYSRLRHSLSNKDILAVLAYNGGIGSVSNWKADLSYEDVDDFIEQIPYPETKNYLKKVYKSYWNYVRIYSGD